MFSHILLLEALGKCPTGPELRNIKKSLQEEPKPHEILILRDRFLLFPKSGIDVILDADEACIGTIYVYGEGVSDGYCQYKGDFPEGITFQDNKAEVERKLGPPKKVTKVPPCYDSLFYIRDPFTMFFDFNGEGVLCQSTFSLLKFSPENFR